MPLSINITQGISRGTPYEMALLLRYLPQIESQAQQRFIGHCLHRRLTPAWITDASLTEVFAVLDALQTYEPSLINGRHLATAIERLVGHEAQLGGPYLENDGQLTLLGNLYIGRFLRQVASVPPALGEYLDRNIVKLAAPDLLIHIESIGTSWQTMTATELAAKLRNHRNPDVNWLPPYLSSNTAHFVKDCILASLQKARTNPHHTPPQPLFRQRQAAVFTSVRRFWQSQPPPLRRIGLAATRTIERVDTQAEISLLPYLFCRSLAPVPADVWRTIKPLCIANVFTWIAYTIYDDFIDDEGKPPYLNIANIAQRQAQLLLQSVDCGLSGADIAAAMDRMDYANSWEIAHARASRKAGRLHLPLSLPDYGHMAILADRAYGHIIGVIIAARLYTPKAVPTLTKGLRHYLIARQLNDDLHDWESDLQAGHLSPVIVRMLEQAEIDSTIDLAAALPNLRQQFRHRSLPQLCKLTHRHLTQSKRLLAKSGIQTNSPLWHLVDDIAQSIRATEQLQAQSENFLQSYGHQA